MAHRDQRAAVDRDRRPAVVIARPVRSICPAPPPAWHATRARLGMPSHAAALLRRCPWCRAGVGQSCHVRATGHRLPLPHEAREPATALADPFVPARASA